MLVRDLIRELEGMDQYTEVHIVISQYSPMVEQIEAVEFFDVAYEDEYDEENDRMVPGDTEEIAPAFVGLITGDQVGYMSEVQTRESRVLGGYGR